VARDFRRSFGDTAEIRLIPENDTLRAGTDDLIFLEISAYDKDGIHVANANNRVFVNVSGAGRLVGLDNGDSTDYEQYKGISRRLFSGKLLAVIAAKSFGGDINVTVTSPSLPDSKITLKALDFTPVEGFCEVDENSYTAPECPDDKRDIPVRKITFACEDTTFTADCRERTFITEIHPKNAVYGDEIQYKITNATGIKSNIAEIVSNEGGKVTVRCLGDGEFYLRAVCKNGTDRVHLISAVKLKGEGLGAAFFNPYTLIAGGLYNVSGGEVQNGIGQGASFAKGESWFGFKNIDFGKIGSDTISLPIFSNRSTPVQIKVYDGTPEDGELIGDFSYFVPAIWLTYQPLTYKLNKILKGVHTVTLLAYEDFDLEGILFEETPKEIATLFASDCESVYGDKFTVGDGEITGIGNNVTVDFGEFDFSEKSPTAVIITGRSELPVNSIHIMFEGETEKRVLAEFKKSEEYTERSFALEGIRGKCRVLLTFLPGTEFDLRALRFELG
jgi:beta-galactosidase